MEDLSLKLVSLTYKISCDKWHNHYNSIDQKMLLVSPQLTPSNMAWVPSVKYLYSCLQNTLSYGVEIREEGVVNVSADMMYYPYSRWFQVLIF